MSVLKNKRGESRAEFVNVANQIFTPTGKVVVNGNRDGMKRARRKIRTFYRMVEQGIMSYEDLWASVNGILAYFECFNDHNRVLKLRRLFYGMFGFSPEKYAEFKKRS